MVKIQISSLEALERMIGGDTEIEIQLRESIVQNFTRKHLKPLANSEAFQKVTQAIAKEVNEAVLIESGSGWSKTVKLKDEHKEKIKSTIDYLFEQRVLDEVQKHLNESGWKARVDEMLDRASDNISEKLYDTIITRRLDEMVDKKLKEKLGLK